MFDLNLNTDNCEEINESSELYCKKVVIIEPSFHPANCPNVYPSFLFINLYKYLSMLHLNSDDVYVEADITQEFSHPRLII